MKSPDEEVEEGVKIDVENVVKHLFEAYPNAKYIALNTALTTITESAWKDHWYFIGFVDPPVYKFLAGFPAWVANDTINEMDDEWGLFFLHISSKDHYFRGIPIQTDMCDFASPRFFCWRKADDGSLVNCVADELEKPDTKYEVASNLNDIVQTVFIQPTIDALAGGSNVPPDRKNR